MPKSRRPSLDARVYKLERGVFLRLCEAVNTPRAITCYMLASAHEWDQYLDLQSPDPEFDSFADDYLVTESMRKNPRLATYSVRDPKQVAIDRWHLSERICKDTNQRLSNLRSGDVPDHINQAIELARGCVLAILGPLTRTHLDFAESQFRFGPGATSSCSGRNVVLSRKMMSRLDITPRLYPYWRALLSDRWKSSVSSQGSLNLRGYSKVTFVPKDCKTDRPIAIEPHLNIYCQLGLGALLRRRLRSYGIDLDTQAADNRQRASRAQSEGLATIDISSASDTIAKELVWLLLPFDWAALLDTARTEYSQLDGVEYRLEKFSSMGNGFTFELESIIFTAIARSCGDVNAVAFGDDIVCTQESAPLLVEVLNFLGFKVNERKTFLAGTFFESCGYDFWRGINVRPCYFKGSYNDFTSAVIRTANLVRLYAYRRHYYNGCDIRFLRSWLFAISSDPTARKTGVPLRSSCEPSIPFWEGNRIVYRETDDSAGSDGLIRNFDEFTPRRARHGHEGYVGKVWYSPPMKSNRTLEVGAYLASLAWGSAEASRLVEYTRRAHLGATLKTRLVFNWVDLGGWVA